LEPGPITGQAEADRDHATPKQKVPKWALWAGLAVGVIGIGVIVVVGILIGILRVTSDEIENGEAEVAMRATEVVLATEESTLIATDTRTPTRTSTITLTPTEALGVGSTLINEVDGAVIVYVPEGEFLMGNEDNVAWRYETPERMVLLDDYWIYQHPVTNQQYRACVYDSECLSPGDTRYYSKPDFDDHPVVHVRWSDSNAYCQWAGGRLPTEAEWEKSARGTDGRRYPWGNQSPTCSLANDYGCLGRTSPVGSYPEGASPYGAMDMAGNVWEWVADWYAEDYYSRSPYENPQGPDNGISRVLRGGSWGFKAGWPLRVTFRGWARPNDMSLLYGFRCVFTGKP
jgi:eukaryotic-like serine/threonine-protein kinase